MAELAAACRLVLALWLGIAGLLKLRDQRGFRRVVYHYRILPRALVALYAAMVAPAEIVAAAILLSGSMVGAGALLAGLLLLSFAIGVGVNLRRSRDLDCHCFGSGLHMRISVRTLAVDLLLLLPAAVLTWYATVTGGLVATAWPPSGVVPSVLSIVLGLAYSTTLGLLYLPRLLDQAPRRFLPSRTLAPSFQEK